MYTRVMDRQKSGNTDSLGQFIEDIPVHLKAIFAELEALDRKRINEQGDPTAMIALEMNYGLAEAVVPAYFQRWVEEMGGMEWVSLEEVFDVPYELSTDQQIMLGLNGTKTSVRIRGKFDGVCRINGRLWLLETKTKGMIDESAIVDVMAHDLQVGLYLWAIKQVYGETPKGVIYNVIRRPQLKMGVRETIKEFLERVRKDVAARTDFYFMRFNCEIDKDEQRDFLKSLDGMMAHAIAWHEGQYSWKNSHSCNLPGRRCKFLPVCSREDYTYLRRKSVTFPELSEIGMEED